MQSAELDGKDMTYDKERKRKYYQKNKDKLIERIRNIMGTNSEEFSDSIRDLTNNQTQQFFNGYRLYKTIIDSIT